MLWPTCKMRCAGVLIRVNASLKTLGDGLYAFACCAVITSSNSTWSLGRVAANKSSSTFDRITRRNLLLSLRSAATVSGQGCQLGSDSGRERASSSVGTKPSSAPKRRTTDCKNAAKYGEETGFPIDQSAVAIKGEDVETIEVEHG